MKKIILALWLFAFAALCNAQTVDASAVTYTQGATGSTARPLSGKLQEKESVLDFVGCDPTGITVSTACIQSAINAAPSGAEIDIPPGIYAIDQTLQIGDGATNAPSTKNGQILRGLLSGVAANEWAPGGSVILKWVGASGGTMIQVNGPIWGVGLSGLTMDAASTANTCVSWMHPVASDFKYLMCENYRGTAFIHSAYAEPVGVVVGSSDNMFVDIMAKNPGQGGNGIAIGATTTGTTKYLDVARNVYLNDHWDFDGTTATTYGIALQFTDNNTFIENTTARAGVGSGGIGLWVNPPAGSRGYGFPGNIQFYNSPIQGNVGAQAASAWNPSTGIGFWPYPTGDGEVVPYDSNPGAIYGVTDSGKLFGLAGSMPLYDASGAASYAPHVVSGVKQLSGGTVTVTFSGSAAFTSIATYACTVTDESAASPLKVLLNSGASITISGPGTNDYVNYICTGN